MVANTSIEKLLSSIGNLEEFKLFEIKGGLNNRSYRVETQNKNYFLKEYFQDDKDPRNRLVGEFEFCRFSQSHGIGEIAKPFASDSDAGIALYEFIEGVNCRKDDISLSRVLEAAKFFKRLNKHKSSKEAVLLSEASEACFTPKAHSESVRRRIEKLAQIPGNGKVTTEAKSFVQETLLPSFESIEGEVVSALTPESGNEQEKRCLSPSDFGFHNMLIDQKESLRFIDFEYAGWDSPAKMVCDFFCQPRLPVSIEWLESFIQESIEEEKHDLIHKQVKTLYPLYRLKWCCIIMNEFLPEGGRRRSFSTNLSVQENQKNFQLETAKNYFISSPLVMGKAD